MHTRRFLDGHTVVFQRVTPQSNPQALLRGIGGNRSEVSVDRRVLVDLLGRDGALGDSTKTLVERSFTCLAGQRSDVDGCFLLHRWRPPDLRGTTRQRDALLWTEAADISLNFTDRDDIIAAYPKESLWLVQANAKVMRSTLRSVKCRAAKVP